MVDRRATNQDLSFSFVGFIVVLPIMSYGVPSDEVAEDYVQALQSLTMNSRYEISNLTVIAKENTEHALAISEALRLHIKQVGDLSILSIQPCYII